MHYTPSGMVTIGGGGSATTIALQDETVYFLSETGDIEPYLKVTKKVVGKEHGLLGDRPSKEKTKKQLLDFGLLKKYFGEDGLMAMLRYAEENQLMFDVKEDLIKILNSL
jgi:hypothetical protein